MNQFFPNSWISYTGTQFLSLYFPSFEFIWKFTVTEINGYQHREFLVIPKVGKKQEICGVFLGFGCNFPNWENATKTNVGFK